MSLLVVRPPQTGPGYEDDLDNLLDLSQSLHTQVCPWLNQLDNQDV